MKKSAEDIAKILDLSFSTVNIILARADFTKYKIGRDYQVNLDFIESLYNYLELRCKNSKGLRQKYKNAQNRLLAWRRRVL